MGNPQGLPHSTWGPGHTAVQSPFWLVILLSLHTLRRTTLASGPWPSAASTAVSSAVWLPHPAAAFSVSRPPALGRGRPSPRCLALAVLSHPLHKLWGRLLRNQSLPLLALCGCSPSSSLHLLSISLLSEGPGCGPRGLRERSLPSLVHDLIPQLCSSESLVFCVVVPAVSRYRLTYNLSAFFHSPEVSSSVCIFQILYLFAINNHV